MKNRDGAIIVLLLILVIFLSMVKYSCVDHYVDSKIEKIKMEMEDENK